MTGSLQVKYGKYYIVLNTYENSKRRQKWIPTNLPEKGNKRRAEQLLREAIQKAELSAGVVTVDTTLADYVRFWLTVAKRRVDEVTFQGYETLANSHILPYFDRTGLKLQAVTCADLQAYLDEKAQHGRKDGSGGLSPSSLRKHKNILYQTLTEAVKRELLPANPCQFVELPPQQPYESTYYTAAQLQTLFAAMAEDPMLALVQITALYGLRRSELLGLKWDSIDFENGTVTIKHTVSKVTHVELTAAAKDLVLDAAYDPMYGARPLRRYLQHTVENLVGRRIISGAVSADSVLTVDAENGELVIR